MNPKRALALSPEDNVAVALEPMEAGDEVSLDVRGGTAKSLKVIEEIPFGFKLALTDISKGDHVFKYGEIIGRATANIQTGSQVHVHNIEGVRVGGNAREGETS